MSVNLSLLGGAAAQFFDNSGNVLTGGKLYTYACGTTTPLATYTTNLGNVAWSNPIVLDAAGRVSGSGEIWIANGYGYKFVLKDSNDVLIATYDNIPSFSSNVPIINDASSVAYEQGYTVTAGNFVVGKTYLILTLGDTNFQTIGASANQVGLHFVATGVGSGTGTAQLSQTVQSKLQEYVSLQDFGAVGDGTTDDANAISRWLADGPDYAHVSGICRIASDLHIDSTKTLVFDADSGFSIDNGVTVTIDAEIIAGDSQIFFCVNTGKVVATNNQNGTPYYPIRTPIVKAIWFGVLPDAQFPTNSVPDPTFTGSITLGTTPSGTDSTSALKMAIAYCQYLCVKGGQANYVTTNPTLALPSGQIYVQGNNCFGNQIFTDQVASVYATADASGNPLTNTYMLAPYYLNSNSYNMTIEGNNCVILWKLTSSADIFWNSTWLTGQVHARNFTVTPITPTDNWGTFFYNKGLCTKGSTANYTNNFGQSTFDNVNVRANINGANSGAAQVAPGSTPRASLSKVWWMDGYSRADNITIRDGHYNDFYVFWQGDNPEAVDLRFENNLISLYTAGSAAFVFTSFYDGFVASGNFFDFKANNTSLLQELNLSTNYIGNSLYDEPTYYFLGGNRYEFGPSYTGINMFVGYSGTFDMDGLNIGTGGTPAYATDADVSNTGNAIYRNSRVSGTWKIANDYVKGQPAVTYDNCQSFINGTMGNYSTWQEPGLPSASYTFYRNLVANTALAVPSIRYINQQGNAESLPLPEYYGTQTAFWQSTTAKIIDRSIDKYARWGTGNVWFNIPPFSKITSIKLFTEAGSFDGINIIFGKGTGGNPQYNFVAVLAGTAQYGLELIPSGECLIAPTSDVDYLYMEPIAYNGVTPVAGGVKGWLEITYAAAVNAQDLLPTLGNDVVVQQSIV